jgi:hypothetical protein
MQRHTPTNPTSEVKKNMSRRILAVLLCVSLLGLPGLAADRDTSRNDLRGIPHGHKHLWAVIGGTAVGAGLGAIGGTSGFFKGGLIGGSAASLFYLAGHRHEEGPWSYVITNAALVAGIGWAVCDCGGGFGAGALIGGGGTALFQSFKPRSPTLAKVTCANTTNPPDNTVPAPPPPQQYPPPQNPSLPQSDQPQATPPPPATPPAQPQTAPEASPQPTPQAPPQSPPPTQPQTAPQTPPTPTPPLPQGQQSNPPQALLLPDAPEPKAH